ncbi:mCG144837, partial [Mus musculus]
AEERGGTLGQSRAFGDGNEDECYRHNQCGFLINIFSRCVPQLIR